VESGTIIFLNGTSSSGKTEITKSLQEILDGYYFHTGIDHYLRAAPDKFHIHSDGINPSSTEGFLWVFPEKDGPVSEIRIGPMGFRLLKGMYQSIAALAASGIDLIVDDVIFDANALKAAVDALHTFNVLFVGIRCPIEVANLREQERGDRLPGLVQAHYDRVHSHGVYDLEVDTSNLTPMECAQQIKVRLLNGPAPKAVRQLRNSLSNI